MEYIQNRAFYYYNRQATRSAPNGNKLIIYIHKVFQDMRFLVFLTNGCYHYGKQNTILVLYVRTPSTDRYVYWLADNGMERNRIALGINIYIARKITNKIYRR